MPEETTIDLSALGVAEPDEEALQEIVRVVLDDVGARVLTAEVTAVGHDSDAPATGGLHRAEGTAVLADGTEVPWRAFVKTFRHVRHWQGADLLPEPVRERFVEQFPWRAEADLLEEVAASSFEEVEHDGATAGLRTPLLYAVLEPDAEHVAVWMEDVDADDAPWGERTFARAAFALGHVAARRRAEAGTPPEGPGEDYSFVLRVNEQVRTYALPMLSDDATWLSPHVTGVPDVIALRADLTVLGERLDDLVEVLRGLPHVPAHGDASPQNLLVPRDDPSMFVAVDWSPGPAVSVGLPVGFDVAQLLVGTVQAGDLPADRLPLLLPVVEAAYRSGLAEGGVDVSAAEVHRGVVASAVLRSAFTMVPVEMLDAPVDEEHSALFTERVRAARWLVDLAGDVLD